MQKVLSPTRRKGAVLITHDGEFGVERSVQTNPVKLALIFLVTSSPFTTRLRSLTPLSCRFFTDLLFLCLKGIKASCSDHFFRSLYSCEGFQVHVKIQ